MSLFPTLQLPNVQRVKYYIEIQGTKYWYQWYSDIGVGAGLARPVLARPPLQRFNKFIYLKTVHILCAPITAGTTSKVLPTPLSVLTRIYRQLKLVEEGDTIGVSKLKLVEKRDIMGSLIPRPVPPKERPDTHCLCIIERVTGFSRRFTVCWGFIMCSVVFKTELLQAVYEGR